MGDKINLTERQLDIMRVLWKLKEATIVEVRQKLARKIVLSRNATATILARLEKRGLIDHRKIDKTFVYFAVVEEKDIQKSMVSGLKELLFGGESVELVSCLLSDDNLSAEEIKMVKELIAARERESK